MKKLLHIIVLFTVAANAQIVTIPDANFKAKLIALGVDTNSDGLIQVSEALVPTTLNLNNSNISNITGIEAFTNLQSLDCTHNQFTSLNLSNSTGLVFVNCFNNQLSSINLSGLTNLKSINCGNNNLSSLNVNGLINLEALNCYNNDITALNVTGLLALKTLDCNTNQITSLNVNGLTNLLGIYCYNNLIPTLTVTGLPNLTNLDCSNNLLTSLNVSNNNVLQVIYCFGNQLPTLNFSNIPALKWFDCHNNLLPSLNVSMYSNLMELKCYQNNISNLNVGGLINLKLLYCSNNQLSSIDVLSLSSLEDLQCLGNQLTTLNLNGLSNLYILECSLNQLTSILLNNVNLGIFYCVSNQLTTIDISSMTNLEQLFCDDNQLTSLFVKNGRFEELSFSQNPDLDFICVDEEQIAEVLDMLSGNGQTAVVNSYCTFNPGGDYNIINGTITFDSNNNGCDASDVLQPNIRININDGNIAGGTFTNTAANYAFYLPAGSFDITPSIENIGLFNVSPPTATIAFPDDNNNVVTQNFCLSANGISPDVEVVIAPVSLARPGFDAEYLVVYKNKGNQTLTGNVTFAYNDAVLDYVSSTVVPNSVATGLLSYDYTNLLPFENRAFYITLNVNAPTETPPVNINDELTFVAVVNPVLGDINQSDNTFQYDQTVVGSFDPNNIICIEGNVVSPSEIGNYLHYVINFENTGNAAAENIVLREVIDESQFDVSSLQLLNSSASVTARLTGNVAEFIFPNINLHSGGHGNILLKIKSRSNLSVGDMVSKKANIYFDYNFPVETLPEDTIFQLLSNPDVVIDASVSIYPNPTKGLINIECNNNIKSVQLYDVQGRILQSNVVNQNQASLDISTHSNGIYFIKIISDKGMKVQKIVRD